MPRCFCQVGCVFFGCGVGLFFCLLVGLVCVFLFVFVYGYVGCGLVMVWFCVGNCFVFVKCVHIVGWVCFVCLVVVLSSAL